MQDTVANSALKIHQHWLNIARQRPSENFNARPSTPISLVVIHSISLPNGAFSQPYIEQFFTNQLDFNAHPSFASLTHLKVSAHLLIQRGGNVVQFVAFDQRAWHAGVSVFHNRNNCNDFSIGIELEGDEITPYAPAQYRILRRVLVCLKAHYPIIDIVGHNEIAPGRKSDPGKAFDWQRIRDLKPKSPPV